LQFCNGNNVYDKCNGKVYDPSAMQYCYNDAIKTYKTVKIGNLTWMAENLNYNVSGSKCYGDQESNCNTYGRLYKQSTAAGVCPKGWHLPSNYEWTYLTTNVGGSSTAGTKLKATSGWNAHATYGNGTDDYSFSALPGYTIGTVGLWWSSSYKGSYMGAGYAYYNVYYCRRMDYDKAEIASDSVCDESSLLSVRCVKDLM
jgi:uncharacterized protein (TIGR02145 family)